MILTTNQLSKILPNLEDVSLWVDVLNKYLPQFDINTINKVSCFLAQCEHESGFVNLEENLNYSADALLKVWPKRFRVENVQYYARNPQRIANYVYANRMGNGPENSGDGWLYRGRGLIQITGKINYQNFAKFAGKSIIDTIPYLITKEGSVHSACWFWNNNKLNKFAEAGNMTAITEIINGGHTGLENRLKLYGQIKLILA
jgi:putative chitinase